MEIYNVKIQGAINFKNQLFNSVAMNQLFLQHKSRSESLSR